LKVAVTDYFFAALLDMAGYWLIGIQTNPTTYSFDMPHQASHDEMLGAYQSGEQGLTDVFAYVNSLKKLTRLQQKARDGGEWWDKNYFNPQLRDGKRGE
jgi:hypothetical protein